MKIINKNKNTLMHTLQAKTKDGIKNVNYTLNGGATDDIPDEIAEIWLQIPGVEKYLGEEDLKKAQKQAEAKAKEEIKKLSDELETAKAEIKKLQDENQKLIEAEAKAKEEIAKLKEANKKSNSDK